MGIAIVPDFMLVAVVKDQAPPFFPGAYVVSNSNPATTFRPWNDQSKVKAQHAFVWSAMGRDVLTGREESEHPGPHARNFV